MGFNRKIPLSKVFLPYLLISVTILFQSIFNKTMKQKLSIILLFQLLSYCCIAENSLSKFPYPSSALAHLSTEIKTEILSYIYVPEDRVNLSLVDHTHYALVAANEDKYLNSAYVRKLIYNMRHFNINTYREFIFYLTPEQVSQAERNALVSLINRYMEIEDRDINAKLTERIDFLTPILYISMILIRLVLSKRKQ